MKGREYFNSLSTDILQKKAKNIRMKIHYGYISQDRGGVGYDITPLVQYRLNIICEILNQRAIIELFK